MGPVFPWPWRPRDDPPVWPTCPRRTGTGPGPVPQVQRAVGAERLGDRPPGQRPALSTASSGRWPSSDGATLTPTPAASGSALSCAAPRAASAGSSSSGHCSSSVTFTGGGGRSPAGV